MSALTLTLARLPRHVSLRELHVEEGLAPGWQEEEEQQREEGLLLLGQEQEQCDERQQQSDSAALSLAEVLVEAAGGTLLQLHCSWPLPLAALALLQRGCTQLRHLTACLRGLSRQQLARDPGMLRDRALLLCPEPSTASVTITVEQGTYGYIDAMQLVQQQQADRPPPQPAGCAEQPPEPPAACASLARLVLRGMQGMLLPPLTAAALPALQHLQLEYGPDDLLLPPPVLDVALLAGATGLQVLVLRGGMISGLHHLVSLARLQHLSLHCGAACTLDLAHLAGLQQLRCLRATCGTITCSDYPQQEHAQEQQGSGGPSSRPAAAGAGGLARLVCLTEAEVRLLLGADSRRPGAGPGHGSRRQHWPQCSPAGGAEGSVRRPPPQAAQGALAAAMCGGLGPAGCSATAAGAAPGAAVLGGAGPAAAAAALPQAAQPGWHAWSCSRPLLVPAVAGADERMGPWRRCCLRCSRWPAR